MEPDTIIGRRAIPPRAEEGNRCTSIGGTRYVSMLHSLRWTVALSSDDGLVKCGRTARPVTCLRRISSSTHDSFNPPDRFFARVVWVNASCASSEEGSRMLNLSQGGPRVPGGHRGQPCRGRRKTIRAEQRRLLTFFLVSPDRYQDV